MRFHARDRRSSASGEASMETAEIVKLFRAKAKLIKPSAVEALKGRPDEEVNRIADVLCSRDSPVITESDVHEQTNDAKTPDFVEVKRASDFHPTAKEYGHEFKVQEEWDVTGRSKCSGTLDDFVKYMNDRYQRTKEVLLSRPSRNRVLRIELLDSMQPGNEVRLIGLVSRKLLTKNKHFMLDIEDDSGLTTILVLNDKRVGSTYDKATRVINDEVIAVDIKIGTNLKIATDITWPDVPLKPKKTIEKDLSIAYIADTHIGSMHFQAKSFEGMLKWLNGNGPHKEIAEKIGYLMVGGDIADGIGNYPHQEKELVIKDVFEQYALFNKFMELVPDHIEIIVIPGNHDAVRHAEPQPAMDKTMIAENGRTISLSNPAHVTIEGLKTQMYHGYSMQALIADVPGLSFARPEEISMEFLKRRNFANIYDKNTLSPEHKDYMFTEECDMLFSAHVHKIGYSEYHGCVLMNSGTWLDKTTAWQLRLGFIPTPAVMGVYNMKTGHVAHLDFNKSEAAVQ